MIEREVSEGAAKNGRRKIIEETRQYIGDFDRVAGTTTTARGLYDKMLELYPDRVNPGERSSFRRARPNRNTFIEKGGLSKEQRFDSYPDSVVPGAGLLSRIALACLKRIHLGCYWLQRRASPMKSTSQV